MKQSKYSKPWYLNVTKASVLMPFLGGNLDLTRLDEEQWSLLFAESRSVGLQARITTALSENGHLSLLPPSLQLQVAANFERVDGFHRDVTREIRAIEIALKSLDVPRFLLKGAAYVHWQLPPMKGRFFSDIDLLVPREALPNVESILMLNGWIASDLSDYDQRYYRDWSHEVPPLTHLRRGSTIDLHHSLVMPTCRLLVDSVSMIANGKIGEGGWWRLSDEDLLLHSVAHLLLNSEFTHGLRDLSDIDLLYRHFLDEDVDFASRLEFRAKEVGLYPLLRSAASLANSFFRTPFPASCCKNSSTVSEHLLATSCSVRHPETKPSAQAFSDLVLSIREVYYRFPWDLLVKHLFHKATSSFASAKKTNSL